MKIKKLLLTLGAISLILSPSYNVNAEEVCNHVWVEDFGDKGDCMNDGYMWYNCIICYDSKKEIIKADPNNHDWSDWDRTGYACEDGYFVRHCYVCEKEEKKEDKATEEHLWSDWEIIKDADCKNDGEKYRYCDRCYTTEKQTIPADSSLHDWSSWDTIDEPTALSKGKSERYCYTCKKTETKTLAKLKAEVKLMRKSKTIYKGDYYFVDIKSTTYGDEVKKWTSSNKKIATVSRYGEVHAKKKGKATITVVMDSGAKASIKITVK